MKKSVLILILSIIGISCNNAVDGKYIINKWKLSNVKIEDESKYLNSMKVDPQQLDNRNLTEEQKEAINSLGKRQIENIKSGNWREKADKESIAFTNDGKLLNFNSDLIGGYKLSLDNKRLMISRPNGSEDTWDIITLSKNKLEVNNHGLIMTYESME